ncbi:xanthine phosphoribosyltransferase [Natranaerobius trueperi]|uniref:Xanthine phosphoribosyltransferase n=1 Tax=Natranaerobius trueperi TaxID=759412 RepID=A0A226BZJ9_9FIRM|nr:xanthine phosphoribosyltransferase [Natranaerobius trueperi]OWZ84416.1 xanthine phosphoribosyltransferase [Natranaerobius trueperi]
MQQLLDRMKKDGIIIDDNILKVDTFLNHKVDPKLMKKIGQEFINRFKDSYITKILTIESSGISPALFTAYDLDVDMVFARKKKSLTMSDDVYQTEVFSYTKKETNNLIVSKNLINSDDNVLVIDDFLANGEAAKSLANIIEQAGANLIGFGIVIEKTFQSGREKLNHEGYRVESLARIKSIEKGNVYFY